MRAPARLVRRTRASRRRPTPRARRRGPQADMRATEAPDPEGAPARPSGGHDRDGGTRNRWHAGVAPHRILASVTLYPDGAWAQPLRHTRQRRWSHSRGRADATLSRTRARQRRPFPRARQRSPSSGRARVGNARHRGRASAAAKSDARAAAAATSRSRQSGPSGGQARDYGARPQGAPVWPLRRTRGRLRIPTGWVCHRGHQMDTHATAAPDLNGTPARPLKQKYKGNRDITLFVHVKDRT